MLLDIHCWLSFFFHLLLSAHLLCFPFLNSNSKTCHLAQSQGKGKSIVQEEVKEEFDFNNLLVKLNNVESKVEEVAIHQRDLKNVKK